MRIAVVGSNGQVGSEIVRAAHDAGLGTLSFAHQDLEVTDLASVERALSSLREGDVVVNTAAFHRTDECEDAPDRALSINAVGAYRIALEARRRSAAVAFISSDFVFDGEQRVPYLESAVPHPLNVYGMTKHAGELLVRSANTRSFIVRISAVFGVAGSSGKGGNFVETMVAAARAGIAPRVVDDIVMAPTSASDAATLLVRALQAHASAGIYHLANEGHCSWWEFANAIFELVGSPIRAEKVHANEVSGKAPRPRYSVLASAKLEGLGLRPRPWRDALADYLTQKGHTRKM